MNLTGYIGSALIFVGIWRVGSRDRSGFIWAFIGELLWVQRGIETGLLDLTLLSIAFVILNGLNWVRWGHDDSIQQEGLEETR